MSNLDSTLVLVMLMTFPEALNYLTVKRNHLKSIACEGKFLKLLALVTSMFPRAWRIFWEECFHTMKGVLKGVENVSILF